MIRLFAAIAIPAHAGQRLTPICSGVPGATWHEPEKLHLTLRFIGGADEARAEDLDGELRSFACESFDLVLAGAGAFESRGIPNHLWVGAEPTIGLTRLHKACERAARRAGFAADVRNWRPHVTLAYLFGTEPPHAGAWIAAHNLTRLEPISVTSFGLYSSWPRQAGRVYRLEQSYGLTPPHSL